ncbi:DUF1302 family protein [Glaciecola sp. SC05]|uniref:DUF1302 family protein n=1 Tax=Glaciecola sp. SC05 TaxID=1987355 RepID=UPI003529395F
MLGALSSDFGKHFVKLSLLLVAFAFFWLKAAHAASDSSTIVAFDYRLGIDFKSQDISLSRLTVNTQTEVKLNHSWSAQLDLRAEFAEDDVGLGSTFHYAKLNRPLVENKNTRFEIDRAFLQWRSRAHSFTLGKQVTPWGVLDGIQITDRFDPVRRRDFVFTDVRPDRLARWGGRWRNKIGGFSLDASLAFDGTVSQQAEIGAQFFNTSPRFTGGLDITNIPLTISSQRRNSTLQQSTFGLRISHSLGDGDLSLLSFRGPDTDPIISMPADLATSHTVNVSLSFPRRSLFGASYDITLGETVVRGEVAYIPDQTVNIISSIPLQTVSTRRLLAGLGIDWNAPAQWFVNAQVAIDYLDQQSFTLLRPNMDAIMTVRAQRLFSNGRLLLKGELLGSLNQQDGVLRPEFAFEYSDQLKLRAGLDYLFGNINGQFGQFKDNSRVWIAASYTF